MGGESQMAREQIKQQRRALTPTEVAIASAEIAQRVLNLSVLRRARNIGIYLAAFGEVDCTAISHYAWQRKKRIFAPILRKQALLFAPLHPGSELQKNRFGILEPVHTFADLVRPPELDVVLVPLVAFDTNRNRLGMGAGYYDRSFAQRLRRRRWRKPRLLGVAYSFQRVASIQPQAWDVPLDAVITEKECFGSC